MPVRASVRTVRRGRQPGGSWTTNTNQPRTLPPLVGAWQLEPLDPRQRLLVERRDSRPRGEHLLQALELGQADRAGDIGEPVVEAEAVVIEPAHVWRAALVALGVEALLERLRRPS